MKNFTLAVVVVTFVFFNGQARGQISSGTDLNAKTGFAGSTFTCAQATPSPTAETTIRVPRALAERAKVKARLAFLLRESLFDDAGGIVNLAREKEIRKLADKVRRQDD